MTIMRDMLHSERTLWEKGVRLIAGIDEVGKGPLAGPLVASAVILNLEEIFKLESLQLEHTSNGLTSKDTNNDNHLYTAINDSKKVSDKKRRLISEFLHRKVIDYSVTEVSHELIDKHGITSAVQLAFYQSVKNLKVKPEHVLTDFVEIRKITRIHQTNIIQGDSNSLTVAAASIIAKVYRDDIMINMHEVYPQYKFHKHKGYGTKEHIQALKDHGPCKIHRKSFEPVKTISRFYI